MAGNLVVLDLERLCKKSKSHPFKDKALQFSITRSEIKRQRRKSKDFRDHLGILKFFRAFDPTQILIFENMTDVDFFTL